MDKDTVLMGMGAGGKLSSDLIEEVFLHIYGNKVLNTLDDAAELKIGNKRIAFTTDSFTVKPIFFPGGDIGKLCVSGTANDLSAKGAKPLAISAGFIIEEGFSISELKKIVRSMRQEAERAGVTIVTGDTKVVGHKEADGIFINTSGIGEVADGMDVSCVNARPKDQIICTGSIADHGMAILNARHSLGFIPEIESDVAPLHEAIEKIFKFQKEVRVMRDPTRGGVAGVLNEIAKASKVVIKISEQGLLVRPHVSACCELLGLDPLYVANEGKMIIFVSGYAAEEVLGILRSIEVARDARIIAEVTDEAYSEEVPAVYMETAIGTKRFVPLYDAEALPRIC